MFEVTLVLVVGALVVLTWWLVWLGPTRGRAVAIRLFRNPHAFASERHRQSRTIDFTVKWTDNLHENAECLFSTSLFIRGDPEVFATKYLEPLLRFNAEMRRSWKSWYYRVYVPDNFDPEVRDRLLAADMEVCTMKSNNQHFEGTLWRFLPLFAEREDDIVPFLCCDADSDYSKVWNDIHTWLRSNKTFFHIRAPVINRFWPISAGMWGCKPHHLSNQKKHEIYNKFIANSSQCSSFGCDELFLAKNIHPLFAKYGVVQHQMMRHVEPLVVVGVISLFIMAYLVQRKINAFRARPQRH